MENLAKASPEWQPTLLVCEVGTLIGVRCPGPPPDHVMRVFRPKELAHAAQLPPRRRREWLAGRLCLRRALANYDAGDVDLLPLPWGPPCVPDAVSASISHKGSLAVAFVVPRQTSCGVDVEEIEDRDVAIVNRVMTVREQSAFGVSPLASTLHFSAKEAVYKCLGFEAQANLDFDDIEFEPAHVKTGSVELRGLVWETICVRVVVTVTDHLVLSIATRS